MIKKNCLITDKSFQERRQGLTKEWTKSQEEGQQEGKQTNKKTTTGEQTPAEQREQHVVREDDAHRLSAED